MGASDLDDDDDVDIVVADWERDEVLILWNGGNGIFGTQQSLEGALNPLSLAIGDWNDDDDPDIAVSHSELSHLTVFINNGSQGFDAAERWVTGSFTGRAYQPVIASTMFAGDLDGNGAADLATLKTSVANVAGQTAVVLGKGNGRFHTGMMLGVGSGPSGISGAEISGDGVVDLVVARTSGLTSDPITTTTTFLVSTATDAYTRTDLIVGFEQADVYMGLLDADDEADLALLEDGGPIHVYTGDGAGSFSPEYTRTGTSQNSLFADDLDNDGDTDLVSGNMHFASSKVKVFLNNGSAGFDTAIDTATDVGWVTDYNGADMNGDTYTDLLVAGINPYRLVVHYNDGSANFSVTDSISVPLSLTTHFHGPAAAGADLDGDDDVDLVVVGDGSWPFENPCGVGVYENLGSRAFGTIHCINDTDDFNDVMLKDLDGDDDVDIAAAREPSSGDGAVVVFRNQGDGGFDDGEPYAVGQAPIALFSADLDGDGDTDVAIANRDSGDVTILYGLATNTPPNAPSSPQPSDGAMDQSFPVSLRWVTSDPDFGEPLEADVYLGTSPTPPLVRTAYTGTQHSPTGILPNTTYYWKIVARDSRDAEMSGPVWEFTTAANPVESVSKSVTALAHTRPERRWERVSGRRRSRTSVIGLATSSCRCWCAPTKSPAETTVNGASKPRSLF